MAVNTEMMATTTISSTKVKPCLRMPALFDLAATVENKTPNKKAPQCGASQI
ncbi:hypothetical protein VDQ74_04150 [Xanthomonas campestris pv. campestris]|nr:hypothetical protein [Xanthomonas campestris pv. campestris]